MATRAGNTYISENNKTVVRAGNAFATDNDIIVRAGSTYNGRNGTTVEAGGFMSKP